VGAELAEVFLTAFSDADESLRRKLAELLRPYLWEDDPARLLDSKDKARQLGLNRDVLTRMRREGRIDAQSVGRKLRFRADALPRAARHASAAELAQPLPRARRAAGHAASAAMRNAASRRCA
jgi:hypothetical protein